MIENLAKRKKKKNLFKFLFYPESKKERKKTDEKEMLRVYERIPSPSLVLEVYT